MNRARCVAVLAAATGVLAACSGSRQPMAGGSSPGSAPNTAASASRAMPDAPSPYRISLPVSSHGPTTCTVYDPGFATQIIVDSRSLYVTAQCELWAANKPGEGYLSGYEQAAAMPDGLRLCSLTDPHRKLTATVIEETDSIPASAAERASGRSACASIRASGWTDKRVPRAR